MRKFIVLIAFFLMTGMAKAQVGFSYHHSIVSSAFGIGTNPDKALWGEARVGTSDNAFEVNALVLYNFLRRDDFSLYSGAGFGSYLFEGNFTFAAGFNFKPIDTKKNITVFGEFTPLVSTDFLETVFSGSIGVRYYLKKR